MPDQAYIGEISIVAFNFAPRGFASCNGQLLSINANQPLFAILGTNYGGNGTTTFALPDFRGRAPLGADLSSSRSNYALGKSEGSYQHILKPNEIAIHNHPVDTQAEFKAKTGASANLKSPVNAYFAENSTETKRFTADADTTMGSISSISTAKQGKNPSDAHENMQPYLALNFIICLSGNFPSRN